MSKLTIYHGSNHIIQKPEYHKGKRTNDYGFGFYCTESIELAKEWACVDSDTNGFANKYSIDISNLKVLDLTNNNYSILNWMAILLKYRTFDLTSEIAKEAKDYLIKHFYIDTEDYDIVIGHRADDSYFSFARDFVNNTISVRQLSRAMELGELGKQVVIVSRKAFDLLQFDGFENAESFIYYVKRKARDDKARNEYLNTTLRKISIKNDLFVIDIMRRGLKNGDEII